MNSFECRVGRLTIPIVRGVLLDQVTRSTCCTSTQYFDTMHYDFSMAASIRTVE